MNRCSGKHAPTRHAFQWVRGPIGWVPNPVGSEHDNDVVPTECDWDIEFGAMIGTRHVPCTTQRTRTFASTNDTAPLCDQATVEVEANAWANRWNELQQYRNEVIVAGTPPLNALMPSMLRRAAASFPVATGVGLDNISPRALCRLSSDSICCLCRILCAAELLGSWPQCVSLVLIVLLPKLDG